MPDTLEERRRRALWRASHRGTKELDLLIGRFAEALLPRMTVEDLIRFEAFLTLADPELQKWILTPDAGAEHLAADEEHADLISAVRRFHGLE